MFEGQALYGGKRLDRELPEGEEFVLWGLEDAGEVPVGDDRSARKTLLLVSRPAMPDEHFEVGTLSGPIAEMVGKVQPGDLPAVVKREAVETSRGLNPATVLTFVRRYEPEAA